MAGVTLWTLRNPCSSLAGASTEARFSSLAWAKLGYCAYCCSGARSIGLGRACRWRSEGKGWGQESLKNPSGKPNRRLTMKAGVQREKVGPGQESVWDYPRPPKLEPVKEHIRIVFNGETIADTTRAFRVLETSHAPVYYIPPTDVKMEHVTRATGSSFCEWKGTATWWSVSVGAKTAEKSAWSYENPTAPFLPLKGYLSFYAGPMDDCFVGEEKAQPQPGNFYGGWVTSKVVGPFKGGPGSWGW